MKIIKILGAILLAIIAILAILLLVMPTSFSLERSVIVTAPKNVVYDYVKMFRNFHEWSPWSKLDTAMSWNVEGNDGETGAVYSWSGNEDVGIGSQTIISMTTDRIDLSLKFMEPWESEDKTWFLFSDTPDGTQVTWGMFGNMPRPLNIMGLFMNMEKMIAKDYDAGLGKMKNIVEKFVSDHTRRGYFIKKELMPERYYITVRGQMKTSQIESFFAKNFPVILKAIQDEGLTQAGNPSGLYYLWDEANQTTDMAAGIPVTTNSTLTGFTTVRAAGKMLHIPYYGAYEKSGEAHYALDDFMRDNDISLNEIVIEEYVTDPSEEPDTSKWLTNIYYLIK